MIRYRIIEEIDGFGTKRIYPQVKLGIFKKWKYLCYAHYPAFNWRNTRYRYSNTGSTFDNVEHCTIETAQNFIEQHKKDIQLERKYNVTPKKRVINPTN